MSQQVANSRFDTQKADAREGITQENVILDILNRGLETAQMGIRQQGEGKDGTAELTGMVCPILYVQW